MDGNDKRLSTAAAMYLESNDSPAARQVILSRNPGKARIMGAKYLFPGEQGASHVTGTLNDIFESVGASWSSGPRGSEFYTYGEYSDNAERPWRPTDENSVRKY